MPCGLLVTGMPGSGKSVFAEAARALGIPVVSMGDAVRLEAMRRGLSPDAETMGRLSRALREELGPHAVAVLTLRQLPRAPVVVIEGIRSREEVRYFRNFFDRVVVVAIHSSPRTRFARLSARHREDDPRSWEEFVKRDERELALGVGEVIALADHILVNEGLSREEFFNLCKERIARILEELGCSLAVEELKQ